MGNSWKVRITTA
ncbi:hypothetical protein Ahy_A04g019917 isoform C [Arachis hypogaea]|nr:hypothetical protein Ahy_A04g019917 isoform C [Arachis hypogaea]